MTCCSEINIKPIPCAEFDRSPKIYMGWDEYQRLKAEGKITTIEKDYFLTGEEFKKVVSRPWQKLTNGFSIIKL